MFDSNSRKVKISNVSFVHKNIDFVGKCWGRGEFFFPCWKSETVLFWRFVVTKIPAVADGKLVHCQKLAVLSAVTRCIELVRFTAATLRMQLQR